MSDKRKVDVRTLFDGEQSAWSNMTAIDCSIDPDTGEELHSLAKQSFQDECDVNILMARYEKTGVIDHVNRRDPVFDDFSEMPDYQTALNVVAEADQRFSDLPAKVRARFDNDPAKLLAFVSDKSNEKEARDLGLLEPLPEPPPEPPAPVPQPAPPAPAPAA